MSYKEWERKLLQQLNALPKNERVSIADYYREMYGDKQDLGLTDEEILQEFGTPEACANKILSEAQAEATSLEKPLREHKNKISVAYIAGVVFFTLLIILPLASVAVSAVASLAIGAICGVIFILAGVAYCVLAPFMAISGVGAAGITAHIGMGIAGCGVGLLLFVGFYLLTKHAAIWCMKALGFIYGRRKRQ